MQNSPSRRIRTTAFKGHHFFSIICKECSPARYQLVREGQGQSTLLAEGSLAAVRFLHEKAKSRAITDGCALILEWEGRGSAHHELEKWRALARTADCATSVHACLFHGELAYIGANLVPSQEAALMAVLGHKSLVGKVVELRINGNFCVLTRILSGAQSEDLLYAQIPLLRPKRTATPAVEYPKGMTLTPAVQPDSLRRSAFTSSAGQ